MEKKNANNGTGGKKGRGEGIAICLKRQTDLEGPDELLAGVVDADDAEEDTEEDDEAVVGDLTRLHRVALELEVEVAGPDEGEHGAGERADEAHEDTEVGYEDSHEDGEEDDADPPSKAPDLELAIEGPDSREECLWLAAKEGSFQQLASCVIRQRIRQHRFYHQAEINQALEACRVQVVRYHLQNVIKLSNRQFE